MQKNIQKLAPNDVSRLITRFATTPRLDWSRFETFLPLREPEVAEIIAILGDNRQNAGLVKPWVAGKFNLPYASFTLYDDLTFEGLYDQVREGIYDSMQQALYATFDVAEITQVPGVANPETYHAAVPVLGVAITSLAENPVVNGLELARQGFTSASVIDSNNTLVAEVKYTPIVIDANRKEAVAQYTLETFAQGKSFL